MHAISAKTRLGSRTHAVLVEGHLTVTNDATYRTACGQVVSGSEIISARFHSGGVPGNCRSCAHIVLPKRLNHQLED